MRLRTAGIALLLLVLYANNPSAAWAHNWHTGPINCYSCSGLEECSASAGLLRKCENNDGQSCLAVFDGTGAVSQRGCSDALQASCSGPDADCYECRSNGCNNLKSNAQLIECKLCDAQTDDSCVSDTEMIEETRRCNEQCLTALYPRTEEPNAPLEIVRSCLDDLDLDDREECAAGTAANCVACDTDKCNTLELGVRGTCNVCSGGNCDKPESKTCRAVVASGQEQCFIQLDESDQLEAYGCLSQYNVSDADALLRGKRLWTCTGANCNVANALPKPQICKLCNSRTDTNCSIDPTAVVSETECASLLNTDCYTLLRSDGHTERGCLSTLEGDDFMTCLSGDDPAKCSTCNGDNCNVKLQPEERLTCHVCDSSEDSSCEQAPNAERLCVLHSAKQQCVTTLDDKGNTLRGCSSELDCAAGSNSQRCQRCTGANCNTANLRRLADGQPGLWGQELPLSCLSCADAASCAAGDPEATTCSGTDEYCMTVFNEAGAVAARGCSRVVEAAFSSYCDANSGKCHNCNSNDCNTANSLDSYTACVYCDASQNDDCLRQPEAVAARRQCNGQCMAAYLRRNGTDVYRLVRGCLDDKEPKDQELCAAGSDPDCQACSGEACNTAQLGKSSLSCYMCDSGETCEDPQSAVCVNYSPSDRCYLQFDDTNSIVAGGCRSDLDEAFIDKNLERLLFCEANNCNYFDILPRPNDCAVCSSRDDINCAIDPSKITELETCGTLPHTTCATRIDAGFTERGCVSSLAKSAQRACLKGEGNCVLCEGPLCNRDIYPADRRRCHRCNSLQDPTCGSAPAAESVCPRYDENQGCSAKLVNGATYRGCTSEFECDQTDKQYCRHCASDNCNVVDLDALNIGYPGKWTTPPINCYTCSGLDCQGSGLGPLQKCQNNNNQNCATVFAGNGSVVLRGCTDQLYGDGELTDYCDRTPGNCKFCKSSGCNNARQLDGYVDCVLCDGSEQPACVRGVADISRKISCQGSCFTGLYPRSRTELDSPLELARGCLDDLNYDDRLACSAGDLANCVACNSAGCNTVSVPEQRLSCNYCDDDKCDSVSARICTAYRTDDQCYIHVGDRSIKSMGCASDLASSFLQANRRDLHLCTGDNCNVKDVLNLNGVSCAICNSTSDPKCISGDAQLHAVCEHYLYPQCYSHITKDGVLQRGCLMSTDDELFDDCLSGNSSSCQICDSNNCNKQVYPADWQQCLRCDSGETADCEHQPAAYGSYCPTYAAGDKCVVSLESGRTRRGCQSELYCDASQVASCRICPNANCNSADLAGNYVGEPGKWQDLPLSCLVCANAESCASASTSSSTCQGNNKQLCSTVFDTDGQVIARGCSDSVLGEHIDYCEANPGKCPQCKSNDCNDANSLSSYVECYQCDAELDPSCAWETPQRTRQCQGQCMIGMYPRSSAADSALLPTRGCLDDLERADRERCSAGSHSSCSACSGALCNTANIIESPQECYTCKDNLCEDTIPARCVAYREQHQCYIAFDNNSIVAIGCASDFETQVINELVAQQRLTVCEGQNCNDPAKIVQSNICLQCSSLSDPRCATNPNNLMTTDTCSVLPYTECVTHIDADGTTTRGCLSSLPAEDFYGCLTGSDKNCEICNGFNCNGLVVFPEDRLRCHQCDSATTPDCESSPSSSAVCPIYDAQDTCVTSLVNDVTYRGCSSSLKCAEPGNPNSCRTCSSGDACNTIDLSRLNIHGAPGIWQQPPISCRTCSSAAECASGDGGQLAQCQGTDNCVTVFDNSGDVVTARGCMAALDAAATSYCDEQPDNCPRCNSNGCNTAESLDDYVECLVCDSSLNPDCVRDSSKISRSRTCHKACMTAFRPLFGETNQTSYALVRNCLDDLEAEDRESCGSVDNKLCSSCDQKNCNTADLVETRLSCLSCRGDACQDPQPASCANYRESDGCYIEFDEERTVVGLGCLSERSREDNYLLERAKRLLTCYDKDCNTLDSIKEPQSCVLCSSRTDRNCAVSPGSVTSATSCQLTGVPECYERVLGDGSTERGCLSSLEEDEFLACYNGTATNCSSCLGDQCNQELYPAERSSCHICNSEADANCESAPDSLSVCPVYAKDDKCVSSLIAGITYRGCATSLSCEPNAKTCVLCEGDGCNVVDLAALSDDNHGWWQDLPLTCLSCTGDACGAEETTSSERCADNNEQDCITVFGESDNVIARGCQDAIQADEQLGSHCTSNPARCPLCKSNECNNATALTQYHSCIYCDSNKSKSCLTDPGNAAHKRRQCQGQCMSALYGNAEIGMDLVRSCLDDKEPADQLTCSAGHDASCVACSGDGCNVQSVPEDRMSCYHCVDGDCEEPQPQLCDIYKPNDSCFVWLDEKNSIKQMGCLGVFRDQDLESVIKTKRISVCQGENCNKPQIQGSVKCAVCDSREDPACATTPLAVDSFKTCSQLPHTHCVTRVETDGATTRGCLFDLEQTEFAGCLLGKDVNCTICAVDGCNREIFPADRPQCYTCSSADDSSCTSSPSRSSACAWLSPTETCATKLENNVTTRGCSSVIDCDPNDYRNCRSCVGNKCNGIDLANRLDDGLHGMFQPLPLKCHSCAGEHCHSSLGPAVQCTLNVEQDCKTVFEEDGATVRRRGCSDDVDDYEDAYCRQHPELCFICKSNECNDAWHVENYTSCVYCNSAIDIECVTYPQSGQLAKRQCQGKCLVTMLEKDLLRSCLDDKEIFDQPACSSDESGSGCVACDKDNCNTFGYPADRLSCHVCSGSDSDCSSSHAQYCSEYEPNDYCFAKYKEGEVELLGCASSQNSSELEQWRAANLLHECSGANCNELSFLPSSGVCLACDSSKTPSCAQAPTNVTSTETCHAPLADCVTRLQDGHTIRGCLNSLSSSEGNACVANGSCAGCAGNKCNADIFPANRRKCHICNSVADSGCSEEPNHLTICAVYAADDICVATRRPDGLIERGCGTQLECNTEDEVNCKVCDADGCNTFQFNGAAALGGIGLLLQLAWSLAVNSANN